MHTYHKLRRAVAVCLAVGFLLGLSSWGSASGQGSGVDAERYGAEIDFGDPRPAPGGSDWLEVGWRSRAYTTPAWERAFRAFTEGLDARVPESSEPLMARYRLAKRWALALEAGRPRSSGAAPRGSSGYLGGELRYAGDFGAWRWRAAGRFAWLAPFGSSAGGDGVRSGIDEPTGVIGQAGLGGELSRSFGAVEPFAGAAFRRTLRTDAADSARGAVSSDAGVVLGIGARYWHGEALSGVFEFDSSLGAQIRNTINLRFRAEF